MAAQKAAVARLVIVKHPDGSIAHETTATSRTRAHAIGRAQITAMGSPRGARVLYDGQEIAHVDLAFTYVPMSVSAARRR
jgi:hypothetical protein